eukprot:125841-Chlamydomonas_euryale.AAC.7
MPHTPRRLPVAPCGLLIAPCSLLIAAQAPPSCGPGPRPAAGNALPYTQYDWRTAVGPPAGKLRPS